MTAKPDTLTLYRRPMGVSMSDDPTTLDGYRDLTDQLRRELRRRDAQIEALHDTQASTERRIRVYWCPDDAHVTIGELVRTMDALTLAGLKDVALRPFTNEGRFAGLELVASNVTVAPVSAA